MNLTQFSQAALKSALRRRARTGKMPVGFFLFLSLYLIGPLQLSATTQLIGWGNGQSNQLGSANNPVSNVPVAMTNLAPLAGKTIVAVASGNSHTLVLLSEGTMYAWGDNSGGQFGNNSTTSSAVPVPVDTSGVLAGKTIQAIAVGGFNSYALGTDGVVYAWGLNNNGQLGNNSTTASLVPVRVDMSGAMSGKTITAIGVGNSCALALSSDGLVFSWGWPNGLQLGIVTATKQLVPVPVDTSGALAGKTVSSIAVGSNVVYALATDGHVYAWGSNFTGALGNNSSTDSQTPVAVSTAGVLAGKNIVKIAAGANSGYALASTGEFCSWGSNSYGQLGNGTFTDSHLPVAVNTSGVLAGKTIASFGANTVNAYALATDGTVYSWGASILGALGISNPTGATNVPVAVDTSGPLASAAVTQLQSGMGFSSYFVLASGPSASAPVITINPANITVNAGATATFTAAASGAPTPTVQWQSSTDGGATFSNVAGATTTTLSVPSVVAGQNGTKCRAVFTNASGSATTTTATLTVNSAPVVTSNPIDDSVAAGSSTIFSAMASGNPAPSIQWQLSTDGGATFSNIAGATLTNLTLTAIPASASGYLYRAVFTNSVGSAITAAATLTVSAGPAITTNPVDVTVNAGGTAVFTAAASGAPVPTVLWQFSTDGGATFSNVAGATTTTLSVPSVVAGQNGTKFRAVFTNASGTATTTAATLTVNYPPVVTTNPLNESVAAGSNVTLTASASGNPTPTVQWQQSTNNGATFTNVVGATSTTLSLPAIPVAANGNQYRAVFTNSAGGATSQAATLAVSAVLAAPLITVQPVNANVAGGSAASFTVVASGNPALTYQWQKEGVNIPGATNATYTIASVVAGDAGTYTVTATNLVGGVTSNGAILTTFVAAPSHAVISFTIE